MTLRCLFGAFPLLVSLIVAVNEAKVVQFIFGDSLSDVGNNNFLTKSIAKAALPWYGIDFGDGLPNGRFTNGRTVADIVGDRMGLPRPPSFMDQTLDVDTVLKMGVNFASGGAGILNETGSYFVQRICMNRQIELFQGIQNLIRSKIGTPDSNSFFGKARYVVAIGSNDFINNYLVPGQTDSIIFNDRTFVDYLIQNLHAQLTTLYGLGARDLTVFGLGPMGCIPLQRALTPTNQCQTRTNNLALAFNKATDQLVTELAAKLPNATFQYGDAYDVVNDLVARPAKYGFTNSDSPCCSFGKIKLSLTCIPISTLCKDRTKYVFWDEYHPSDSANQIIADELIKKFRFLSAPSPASPPSSNG